MSSLPLSLKTDGEGKYSFDTTYFWRTMQFLLFLLLKWLVILAVMVAIAYCGACLFLFTSQNKFIFFPSKQIETTPESFRLAYEEVWLSIQNPKGELNQIYGWWIPASSPTADTILYLHGNGLNIGANVEHAHRLHQLGLSVFLIDYRGYGRSAGDFPTEAQVYQDAQTAWGYLVRQRGIDPSRIFLYGHSLGGAIAIELATRHPEIAGLIVEGSFTSARDMVDYQGRYWMFPIDLLLHQRFDSIAKVPHLKMPLLLIHGTADRVVPPEMSQQLFKAAREPKQLYIIPNGDHNDAAVIAGPEYLQTVRRFLQQASRVL